MQGGLRVGRTRAACSVVVPVCESPTPITRVPLKAGKRELPQEAPALGSHGQRDGHGTRGSAAGTDTSIMRAEQAVGQVVRADARTPAHPGPSERQNLWRARLLAFVPAVKPCR